MADADYNALLGYWHTASWAFIIATIAVFIYAQYKRRSPHPICRKCSYDLASVIRSDLQQTTKLPTPPPTCPECGLTSKKYWFKYPLKRRFVVFTVVLFLIAQLLCMIPRVQERGYIGFIPTWVLAVATPVHRERAFSMMAIQYAPPTWKEILSEELENRLVYNDNNWIHLELIEWRNNSERFSDVQAGYRLRAYRSSSAKHNFEYLSMLSELSTDRSFEFIDPAMFDRNNIHSYAKLYKVRQHEILFSTHKTHDFVERLQQACLQPLDSKFSWHAATDSVPQELALLESLRFQDVNPNPESFTTIAEFSSFVESTTGLEIVWPTQYAAEPHVPPSLFDSKAGPSLAYATISQILDVIAMNHCGVPHRFYWQVKDNKIEVCSFTEPNRIAIAYDLRISTRSRTNYSKSKTSLVDESVYKLLHERVYIPTSKDDIVVPFWGEAIHDRFVIIAPQFIHARIQRLLPTLRAELLESHQTQVP